MTHEKTLHHPAIDEHARAIGYLCIYWAALEHGVDSMLRTLTPLESGQISDSITANADIRDKLRMLKAIGLIRKLSLSWFMRLEETINIIENKLRVARNRYIHDLWMGLDPVKRRTRRTSIKMPQSRQPPELSTYEDTTISASDIWSLVDDISEAQIMLKMLENSYRGQVDRQSQQSAEDRP